MAGTQPAARLQGYLAADGAVAAILRRGPTKWTQLIRWNTQTDTFVYGEWFHGRIATDWSDLSPDGSSLLYLARDYGTFDIPNSKTHTWTALSTIPAFQPIALWPSSNNLSYGGGLFLDKHTVLLNQFAVPHYLYPPPSDMDIIIDHEQGVTGFTILRKRLARDGWTLVQDRTWNPPDLARKLRGTETPWVWKKYTASQQASLLYKFATYGGREYWWRDEVQDRAELLAGVTWADWDHQQRLVYAKAGKLWYRDHRTVKVIADFNEQQPPS